jgi:hypothetical protein
MYTFAQEFIIYNSDQSTDRTDIEENIGGYYDIPLPGLLDDNPGAAAAYSLRRLSSTYTGSAIQVQRADNVGGTHEIGFDSYGELDTTALTTAAQGNDMVVVTWYDQSGNSNDATQGTSANRPKIYDGQNGVVTENEKPAVDFDGSNDFLQSGAVTASSQPITVISITTPQATAFSGGILNTTDSNNFIDFYRNDGGFAINAGTTLSSGATVDYVQDVQYVRFSLFNGANSEIFANGTSVISGNANTTGISGNLFVGKYLTSSNNFMNGLMQEVILYASDQSTNRTDIEDNINTFYDIY